MNKKTLTLAVTVTVLVGAVGFGVYRLGMARGMATHSAAITAAAPVAAATPPTATQALPKNVAEGEAATRRHITTGVKAGDIDPANGGKVLYYQDPMLPGNKFDKPAKSPFMDMMLVPVYADGDSDKGNVTVSSRVQQNLGVRTAEVTEGVLSPQVAAIGSIAFNERNQALVQARATGYVERLHVRATLDTVGKGQPLADLFVPDWVAAQEEFLSLKRMQGNDLGGLVDGARQRMRLVGMSEDQIKLVDSSGKPQLRITIAAPIRGVVTELMVREGTTVMAGTTLFRINGLSTVWAHAEVPESQAALVRQGTKVQARSPAVPGTTFEGKVQAILPEVNPATRTLKARLELANPGALLVPGMFVSMQFMDMRAEKALLIPTEAVIMTGKRSVVMLAEDNGKFRPVEVEAGIESGGQTEIKHGLQRGQRVVVSSQFLIDSEASLKGVEARLNGAPTSKADTKAPRHEGEAKVEAISPDAVTLSHGPIASLKWGAMTMDFRVPSAGLPRNVAVGDRVGFEFYMDAQQQAQLTRITPVADSNPSAAASGRKP